MRKIIEKNDDFFYFRKQDLSFYFFLSNLYPDLLVRQTPNVCISEFVNADRTQNFRYKIEDVEQNVNKYRDVRKIDHLDDSREYKRSADFEKSLGDNSTRSTGTTGKYTCSTRTDLPQVSRVATWNPARIYRAGGCVIAIREMGINSVRFRSITSRNSSTHAATGLTTPRKIQFHRELAPIMQGISTFMSYREQVYKRDSRT